MNLPFPLIGNSGPLLSLDDEDIFHRLLVRVLGSGWPVICFTSIPAFKAEVKRQVELQDLASAALAGIIRDWREDESSLFKGIVRYWKASPEGLASGVLVDFRMPMANGLEVLSDAEVQAWTGGKLLVTAHADDHVAVEAFNGGLISQFVSKAMMAETPQRFCATVKAVCEVGNTKLSGVWSGQVSYKQQAVLNSHKAAIDALITGRNWVRHAVIGEPFGILGLTKSGQAEWLQLETDASLASLLELVEGMGMSKEQTSAIIRRERLVSMEVRPGKDQQFPWAPAVELGSDSNRLLAAVFPLEQVL